MDTNQYLEMTSPELQKAINENRVLFYCVGMVEQHGPHLPTGTDTFLPMEVATRAAKKVGGVVAPCTNYGYKSILRCGGGDGFVGTINLKGSTITAVVKDSISEFIRNGWRHILVLDWHYENHPFVYEGVDEAVRDAECKDGLKILRVDNVVDMAFAANPDIIDFVFEGDYRGMMVEHASAFETSLMLSALPDMVRKDKIIDGRLPVQMDYDVLPDPKGAAPESGVFWKATMGTKEKGDRLMEILVDEVVSIIEKEYGPQTPG